MNSTAAALLSIRLISSSLYLPALPSSCIKHPDFASRRLTLKKKIFKCFYFYFFLSIFVNVGFSNKKGKIREHLDFNGGARKDG